MNITVLLILYCIPTYTCIFMSDICCYTYIFYLEFLIISKFYEFLSKPSNLIHVLIIRNIYWLLLHLKTYLLTNALTNFEYVIADFIELQIVVL